MTTKSSIDVLVSQWEKERPELNILHFGIQLRIRSLAMLMDRRMERVCVRLGVRLNDLYILYALRRSGPPYRLRPTDVYNLLHVTSGALTHKIDNLEKTGLVRRVAASGDRRSTLIEMTAQGKSVIDQAVDSSLEEIAPAMDQIFENKDEAELFIAKLSQLGGLFDRLVNNDGPERSI